MFAALFLVALSAFDGAGSFGLVAIPTEFVRGVAVETNFARGPFVAGSALHSVHMALVVEGDVTVFGWENDNIRCDGSKGPDGDESNGKKDGENTFHGMNLLKEYWRTSSTLVMAIYCIFLSFH
jgi:hypothetical protein